MLKHVFVLLLSLSVVCNAQDRSQATSDVRIDVSGFRDGAHHWYDIADEGKVITPLPDQPRYAPTEIQNIADNILLYQKANGGWQKNYDMLAILTDEQRQALVQSRYQTNTTFDNGATYSQTDYLARAYSIAKDERYKLACLRGIEFILSAQYPNGGFPQFFPDTIGYANHITFNDGAMIGVMRILKEIVQEEPRYGFVEGERRRKVRRALEKGIECILRCQIEENGTKTAWCQQHDNTTLSPQHARTFELASICNQESAEIVLFLMSLDHPTREIVNAIHSAWNWFERSRIFGVRLETIAAPSEEFKYHRATDDRIVVADSTAPPLWARFNELGTHRPLFCNRDGKPVYSLAEVERERRTGYAWYTYAPQKVLDEYPQWNARIRANEASDEVVARDTSFTIYSAFEKVKKDFPFARIAEPILPKGVIVIESIVYAHYGKRKLHLDIFAPEQKDRKPRPAVLLIHGGGWASGEKSQQAPLAQQLASRGYIAATVEYRLSPEAQYPAAVHDLKAAVRWLRAHANDYKLDPNRIGVLGCSSGGHLAAFLGATNGMENFEGNGGNATYSSAVQAAVDIDGILDFTHPAESGKDTLPDKPSVGKRWLGASFKDNPRVWIEASPLTHISEKSAPILFINSSIERFHAGREETIAKLARFNIASQVHTVPDTPHTFWLFHPWFERTVEVSLRFLEGALSKH